MDPDLPQLAVSAFERATGLAFCLHDIGHSLWPYLEPQRFEHTNPVCSLIKRSRMAACVALDSQEVRINAEAYRHGIVKRCHAGIVEGCITVFHGQRLEWILFAGIRRGSADLRVDLEDPDRSGHNGPWASAVGSLAAVDRPTADFHLEMLRQLAARLAAWRQDLAADLPTSLDRPLASTDDQRRQSIHHFVIKYHERPLRLADLARHLGLSEDRAGHVVRDLCDETFVQLLTRIRIRTACGLLRFSDLPLRAVAQQSGFGDRGHFFAVFKHAMGTTPTAYRRAYTGKDAHQGKGGVP